MARPDDARGPGRDQSERSFEGAHEPSYYEIALTHRQVLVAFVVLLTSVVAAFFAGVWVGREGRILASPVPEVSAGATPGATGTALEEFEFFSDTPALRPEPAVADPEPGRTLLEDLGGDRDAAVAQATPSDSLTEEETDGPAAPPDGQPTAPLATVPAPAAADGPAATAAGRVFIQVFSSSDELHAKRITERLKGQGFAAFISPVKVGQVDMYRVRVGPFADEGAAAPVADRIRKRLELDTWITR